jgi:hypothetical protein
MKQTATLLGFGCLAYKSLTSLRCLLKLHIITKPNKSDHDELWGIHIYLQKTTLRTVKSWYQLYQDETAVHTILFHDKEQAMLHWHVSLLSAYKLVHHKSGCGCDLKFLRISYQFWTKILQESVTMNSHSKEKILCSRQEFQTRSIQFAMLMKWVLQCTISLKGYDNYPSVSSKETSPVECINANEILNWKSEQCSQVATIRSLLSSRKGFPNNEGSIYTVLTQCPLQCNIHQKGHANCAYSLWSILLVANMDV